MSVLFFFTLIALFIAGCNNSGNKYFTGIVEYSYSYTSDSLNADSIAKHRPAKSFFRFDTTGYQSQFINNDTTTYYYSGKMNKCLSRSSSEDKLNCEDYGAFTDSVISFKLYDTDEQILGYSCKILEVQKKNSWLQYYVSNDLRIAPSTYNKHISYNWDFYGDKAGGGLILKSEHRFKYFTMKGVATAVDSKHNNFIALEIEKKQFDDNCK